LAWGCAAELLENVGGSLPAVEPRPIAPARPSPRLLIGAAVSSHAGDGRCRGPRTELGALLDMYICACVRRSRRRYL